MNVFEYFVKKSLFVNLVSAFVLLIGIIALRALPREAFPPVNYDIVTIATVYRNATAQEVEKLVTIPLEDELNELSGLKEMTSISEENLSSIIIELDPNAKEKNKIVNDIQRAVDRVSDLPEDAEDPVVDEIETGEIPIIQVSLSGNVEEKILRRYAEALEDKLIDIPEVASIGKNGWRDPEIWVEIDPIKTKDYYISLLEIAAALNTRNVNLPGGTLEENGQEFMIRTVGEFETADEIKKVVVRANDVGNWIRIEDIANVKDTFEDDSILFRTNGARSINLVVIKRDFADAIDLVNKVKAKCAEFKKALPPEISISFVDDFSYYIKRRLNVLTSNACMGIVLVLISLLFFMTWRIALLTALGIPVALAATFGIMLYCGISINLLSMFGMIIVVGMLVDDAIIIAENAYRYIEEGMTPRAAAIRSVKEVALPVSATVLTTIAAFIPLLMMTGIMGKFVRHIPIVVIIALAASLLEALFILPSHIADFVKSPKKGHVEQHWYNSIQSFYSRTITFCLKYRYMVLVISVALFIGSGLLAKFGMKFRLFGSEGLEMFFVNIEAPIGTPIEKTEELTEQAEKLLDALPRSEIENYVTSVGIRQTDRDGSNVERGSHLALITVYTTPANNRKRTVNSMIEQLRKDAEPITNVDVKFEKPSAGPPIGKPISVRIKGNDFDMLKTVAAQFKAWLPTIKGVKDVDDDYNVGKKELRIIVDEKQAAKAFLTYRQIARAVNAAFAGGIATTIKTTSDEIDVRIKFREQEQKDINTFKEILILNTRGNLIPFEQVARVEEFPGLATIKHLDKKRVVTVTADINEEITTPLEVNEVLKKLFEPLENNYPDVTVTFSGEQEDTEESMQSLRRSFLLAGFLIFLILATTFQSLMQPLIVMLAIPFGLIGVILTFFVHGQPLGFMAMLGIIGLSGVVVNDAIVLVEFINTLRQQGVAALESIIQACTLRLRPVILTTVTTVLGLLPTAYGWGGNDPFIKPMALALAWGLFFATLTTLIIIPCVTAIIDDVRKKIGHVMLYKTNGKYTENI
jgi:multidrug efflux pump subunit AcrB